MVWSRYIRLDEATTTLADLGAAMAYDYLEGMVFINDAHEQSEE